LHYLHNNVLVIDQSEYIEDRPVPGPFPAFPMTKREKPWERGCSYIIYMQDSSYDVLPAILKTCETADFDICKRWTIV
jgi:hypothetical protein